jgi:hypothetical protein
MSSAIADTPCGMGWGHMLHSRMSILEVYSGIPQENSGIAEISCFWYGEDMDKKTQTPPNLVVKFQLVDIVAVILRLVLRLHFVYQRQIEG